MHVSKCVVKNARMSYKFITFYVPTFILHSLEARLHTNKDTTKCKTKEQKDNLSESEYTNKNNFPTYYCHLVADTVVVNLLSQQTNTRDGQIILTSIFLCLYIVITY